MQHELELAYVERAVLQELELQQAYVEHAADVAYELEPEQELQHPPHVSSSNAVDAVDAEPESSSHLNVKCQPYQRERAAATT